MTTLNHFSLSQKGTSHEVNEDSVIEPFEALDGLFLTGVFDGISGNGGGQHASSRASLLVKSCAASYLRTTNSNREALIKLALRANQEVLDVQKEFDGKMGTTMTLCLIDTRTDLLHVVHIGDSVLFKISDGRVTRLTAEDTDSDGRLTKWLGQPWPLDTEKLYFRCNIEDGDLFVLGSDGFIKHRSILEYRSLFSHNAPEQIVREMASSAETSSKDDITIVVFKYHNETGDKHGSESPSKASANPNGSETAQDSPALVKSQERSHSVSWPTALLLVAMAFLLGVITSPKRCTCPCRNESDTSTDLTAIFPSIHDTLNIIKYEFEQQN